MGLAGVGVTWALLAVAAQAFKVGPRARKDQRGLATGGIANHPDLAIIQVRREQSVVSRRCDRGADLQRPAIEVAEGAQAAMVAVVVAGMDHRHHHEALSGQAVGQVMQGHRAAGVSMGDHQQRELAHGYRCLFGDTGLVALDAYRARLAAGGVERQGLHGLCVHWVDQGQPVQSGHPRRCIGAGQ